MLFGITASKASRRRVSFAVMQSEAQQGRISRMRSLWLCGIFPKSVKPPGRFHSSSKVTSTESSNGRNCWHGSTETFTHAPLDVTTLRPSRAFCRYRDRGTVFCERIFISPGRQSEGSIPEDMGNIKGFQCRFSKQPGRGALSRQNRRSRPCDRPSLSKAVAARVPPDILYGVETGHDLLF